MEVEEGELLDNLLYRDLVVSGAAFGAHRWVATLQRSCERFACFMAGGNPPQNAGGAMILSPEGRRSMMKLAHRMVSSFCASLTSAQNHRWFTIPGTDLAVRMCSHQTMDASVVLSAATSLWLPLPCDRVFSFFRDESTRHQWDGLSEGNVTQEMDCIQNGTHPGNCISLLRGVSASQSNSMLMLQESCTDASGALVVYAPIGVEGINLVMSGADPSFIPLRPSGFSILPDGRPRPPPPPPAAAAPSSSAAAAPPPAGSLLTISFQILVEELPPSRMDQFSIDTVNEFIATTVQKIKAALSC